MVRMGSPVRFRWGLHIEVTSGNAGQLPSGADPTAAQRMRAPPYEAVPSARIVYLEPDAPIVPRSAVDRAGRAGLPPT
jgi:hypothetical protein